MVRFDNEDVVDTLAKVVAEDEKSPRLIDDSRVQAVQDAYKKAQELFKGRGTKVSYALNKPFTSMGYVSVVSKEFSIKDTIKVVSLFKTADNIEVYPKTDGTIQINLTYHGLARKVNGGAKIYEQ
ncbi:MAG: hypothetical protein IJM20_02310 [Clostridia bacterium]|nr:hypothetical protein [Clostridia bacterium]